MGVLDKIKNALFEVEYVEVEEPPKKEKKAKVREKKEKEKVKDRTKEKPIAKKIVLPGKKEEKIEELEEEELKDEDFEIRPKNEVVKDKPHEEFKFMDDKDFQVEEEYVPGNPEILHVLDEQHHHVSQEEVSNEIKVESPKEEEVRNTPSYENSYSSSYRGSNTHDKLYGMDTSYHVPVHEYGTYEKKEDKTIFKPSPIISPIYGILDKNYTKDDVKEKKEVRLTTYSRSNVSVDDIRNKAYGVSEEPELVEDTKFEVEEEEDNVLVDLSDRAKPEVKELTMGDALEYFQDLGLEYNVDYVDVSKEKKDNRRSTKGEEKPVITENIEQEEVSTEPPKHSKDFSQEVPGENTVEIPSKVVKIEDEAKGEMDTADGDNDNLFDLIDSMYEEKGE